MGQFLRWLACLIWDHKWVDRPRYGTPECRRCFTLRDKGVCTVDRLLGPDFKITF